MFAAVLLGSLVVLRVALPRLAPCLMSFYCSCSRTRARFAQPDWLATVPLRVRQTLDILIQYATMTVLVLIGARAIMDNAHGLALYGISPVALGVLFLALQLLPHDWITVIFNVPFSGIANVFIVRVARGSDVAVCTNHRLAHVSQRLQDPLVGRALLRPVVVHSAVRFSARDGRVLVRPCRVWPDASAQPLPRAPRQGVLLSRSERSRAQH